MDSFLGVIVKSIRLCCLLAYCALDTPAMRYHTMEDLRVRQRRCVGRHIPFSLCTISLTSLFTLMSHPARSSTSQKFRPRPKPTHLPTELGRARSQ
ncbi:uncharacterized protein K452DRAFT_130161 [Aplosporella prunicola CBS 121167]|uniref:Uncharacterized protein n=1 Tax=Aplosporella prunicola CBS 121167 TaxID=1176127 RepID=A0A6A6AXZ3_9PEZI|nr:uncharacterized protein K452DRAFT_130161 [Aplosporella prunicola CBS 121167]KAF2136476.1 hypothetical protein K452DRAFT_130161 [Aplosporella prunicola CBS 121167]